MRWAKPMYWVVDDATTDCTKLGSRTAENGPKVV
jgi:hypothetical protein